MANRFHDEEERDSVKPSQLLEEHLQFVQGRAGRTFMPYRVAEPSDKLVSVSALDRLLRFELGMPVAMALVLAPWIAVVLFTAGAWASLVFVAYAASVFCVGYGLVCLLVPSSVRLQAFVLAPAVGILVLSALTAFWVRRDLPLIAVSAVWLVLIMAGAFTTWSDRALWSKGALSYSGALVLLAVVVCVVFTLPGARNDSVRRSDGSFNWMYVDNVVHYAIAAGIKDGDNPPRVPGAATEELLYHFGAYAPSAVISRVTGVELGDAFARVTRGAQMWALVLSCFGLGTLLSLKGTGTKFGGIAAVAGFFFYGSLLSLFTDVRNSSSYVTGAILFKIPEISVLHDGGPFSHLILGHSVLNGFGPITAIMGLCLLQMDRDAILNWRVLIFSLLPALVVPVNSVAGLYCIGIVAILLFWGRLGKVSSWLAIIVLLGFFFAAWRIMGFNHSADSVPDPGVAPVTLHMTSQWWRVVVAFIIGLGIRIVAFRWVSRPWSNPISVLFLATVLGFLSFALIIRLDDGNEAYGFYFLQPLLSIFAFSLLTPNFWRRVERTQLIEEWLRYAIRGMLILSACGLLIGIVVRLAHGHSGVTSFGLKLVFSLAILAFMVSLSAMMKRSPLVSAVGSKVIAGVLLIGFVAWITPWMNYGLGRMKMDVTLSPGEVIGLNRLSLIAAPGEMFATNKHSVDTLALRRLRSYGYTALAERPVFLEGYDYRGIMALPGFKEMLSDNDSMFTTNDPDQLRNIAKARHVRWLVARPDTDMALPRPLPSWLVQQQNCGSLSIYRIDY